MGKFKRTQDPTDVSDAVESIDEMSPRSYNGRNNELHTCKCGAMVIVPTGHAAIEDDDKEVWCSDCDAPLGKKLYDVFA